MTNWNNIKLISNIEIQGAPMKINMEQGYKKPNLFYMTMKAKMIGEIQGMKFNGKTGSISGMQGNKELSGEDLNKRIEEFLLYPYSFKKGTGTYI